MVPNTTDIISRHHPLSQPTQIQQLKLVGITHFQDNIIGNHFKLTPFFTDNKLLLWTQHYMLTDCGRKCRFIETYFIAKDMFTPLVARQRFQTIQKTKKYQLELFFFLMKYMQYYLQTTAELSYLVFSRYQELRLEMRIKKTAIRTL